MVLSYTDCLGATSYTVAGRYTLSGRFVADFFFCALCIRSALVPGDQHTSGSVIRVSGESFNTLAGSLVVAGTALGVERAVEELAHCSTSQYSN